MVQELRLGNWISHKGAYYKIHELHPDYIVPFKTWRSQLQPKKINPIPLTEDILSKFEGCEKISNSKYKNVWEIECSGRYITIINYIEANTWEVTYKSTIELIKPELHMLQNMIFFNWGKELEIKL